MKHLFYSLGLIALAVACNNSNGSEGPKTKKPISVTTFKVKKELVATDLRYSGTVEALQTIPLSFATTGTVEKVFVEPGDEITKGQILATLDPTDAKNMYQITLAKYQQAQDAYNRLKTVYEKGSLPEIKWVEMETNLQQALSSLEISKNNLEKCKLVAPVNGVVGSRNVEPGMSAISLGSAPIELVDIKSVYIKISIPENEISQFKKGMEASLTVTALNNKKFEGRVMVVSPVADIISRTYESKIQVANSTFELKPGMVCDVNVQPTDNTEKVLVPYQSVSKDENDKAYVYLVNSTEKRVKKQMVETGQYCGSKLEIISGLAQGDIIVYEGKEKLTDNCQITL